MWGSGDETCDVFMTKIKLLFEFQEEHYHTDRSGIILLVSLLSWQAAEWATMVIRSNLEIAW